MPDSARPADSVNHVFPRSVLFTSREEFGDREDTPDARAYNPQASHPPLKLRIREGSIPADLCGYVYVVGPVGSVDSLDGQGQPDQSVVVPSLDGTTLLYNGDGMIYRLDFDQPEDGVYLSSRIIKTPCYYADAASYRCPQYQGKKNSPNPQFTQDLRFRNFGITRLSGPLGLRNQLNTAFLPMRFAGEDRDRLLVTWDMGRPYEVDPRTLEAVTPVGRESEWQQVNSLIKPPFKPAPVFKTFQSCAHPIFDPNTGDVFNLNTGRSLANFLSQLLPLRYFFRQTCKAIRDRLWPKPPERVLRSAPGSPELQALPASKTEDSENLGDDLTRGLLGIAQLFRAVIDFFVGNFVDLLVWDGQGALRKWRVLHNGKPIKILQSTHQIGVTEDYILLIDTAFKFAIEELLPSLKTKEGDELERIIREALERKQLPDNYVYIIARRDLQPGKKEVQAKRVIIPYEAAHFLVDYKNPNNRIRMHFSHVCAWDAAECITKFDFPKPADPNSHITVPDQVRPLYGVLYGPTDISRLGYHILDGETGSLIGTREIESNNQIPVDRGNLIDPDWTWGPAIFTYRNDANYAPPGHIQDLYWGSLGCWRELLLPHITDLYKDYKYRKLDLAKIKAITQEGRRSNLIHLHIDPPSEKNLSGDRAPKLVKGYGFPDGYYVTSPQFVPAKDRTGSTDGYIVCIVHYGDGSDRFEGENTNGNEIWIFDARTLDEPICKLYHPKLNIGFTVHSTWMAQAERRTAPYYISPEADYGPLLKDQGVEVKDLFERWVFPRKEPQAGDC